MKHTTYTHDDFFKDIFSAPEQAADLLRFALPKDALESLDLERMEPYPDSFTRSLGADGRADLLFHCPIKGAGNELMVAILFEHKSFPDIEVLAQMARYWANLIIRDKTMPVLPVLFYHNPAKWNPPKFRDRFTTLPSALRDFQPEFPILFIDTNREEDLHIWENEDLSPETKIGLIILKNIFDQGDVLEKNLNRLISLLVRSRPDRQQRLMKSVKLYLVNKAHIPRHTLETTMDRLPEANRMPFKTTAEHGRNDT